MKQKSVGLTLRATILALALILVAGSPALPPFDGVAYAQDAEVTSLDANPLPNGTLSLTWTEVVGADSYRLWKGEGRGQSVAWEKAVHMKLDAPTISYVDTAVTAGMTYSYVIEVYDGDTRLGWSDVENVTMPGGTQKPTVKPNVTLAADGLTAITVTWTEVAGADNYRVRYWTSGLSGWMDLATQETGLTVTHTGLTSGKQYFYIVRGQNAAGNGPYSGSQGNYDSLTLEATDPKPVLTLAHPERLRVELSWTRVSANATYQVQRMRTVTISGSVDGTASEAWANLGAAQSGNTYFDTTVTNASPADADDSTVYSYRVQAIENGIQGDPSDVKTATIPATDALPPTPPALSATPISSSRINVTWGPSDGATSYQLRYKTGDGNYGNPMNMMAKMAYLHTGLNAATEYSYQVRAVNVNGHSDWSSAESATTVAATTAAGRLGVPTGLRAVDATTTAGTPVVGLKVTWNAVAKATGYELRKWDGTEWAKVSLSDEEQTMRSKTDSGLEPGTTYYYIVAALDDNGTPGATDDATDDDDMSDWSAPQSGMTDAVKPTAAPTNLMATPRGENRIWVSWTGVDGVTEYVLQSRRKGTSAWSTINVQGRMTHAHTGLSAGMQYQYRIAAKNSGGMSGWSKEEKGTTWSKQLGTPTGLMAVDATDGAISQIKLTWKAVSGATGYDIQKWEVDTAAGNAWRNLAGVDGVTMADEGMTSHTDTGTGVEPGMTYYYIVRATSGDVMSPWTGAMSGMTKATAPGMPTLVLVSTGQTMVRLSWAAASDTSGYTGWEVQYFEGTASTDELDREAFQKMEMSMNAMPMHHIQRNLKPGTRYSFRIRGTKPLGVKSIFSGVGQIITKPANPTLMASSATTSINLTWALVKPAGLSDATNFTCADYEIQRRKTGENKWVNVDDDPTVNTAGDKCSIIDDGERGDTDGLDSNKLYYYRLRVAVAVADHLPPTIKSYWDQANARTPSQ